MSASPFGLEGRQVVVTGAAGGIGAALLAAFRGAGARIHATNPSRVLGSQVPQS